ncbi:hypothetical protein N9230_02380 [Akkermansiaceae bacterium]|nr:hypothetical protein [Akkermansiaceae bacterium]
MALSRWLQDSPKEAAAWFGEERRQNINYQLFTRGPSDEHLNIESEITLGEAAGYWLVRDPKGAFSWLIKSKGIWEENFARDLLDGIREGSASNSWPVRFLRVEISRIEKEAIRKLFALAFHKAILVEGLDGPLKEDQKEFMRRLKSLRISMEMEKKVIEAVQRITPEDDSF